MVDGLGRDGFVDVEQAPEQPGQLEEVTTNPKVNSFGWSQHR